MHCSILDEIRHMYKKEDVQEEPKDCASQTISNSFAVLDNKHHMIMRDATVTAVKEDRQY